MLAALIFAVAIQIPDTFPVLPADRLIPILGDSFSQRWRVLGDLTKNALFVSKGQDSAEEVRKNLADVLRGEWQEDRGVWTLVRTQEQFRAELATRQSIRQEALTEAKKSWKAEAEASLEPPSLLMRRYENLLNDVLSGDQSAISEAGRIVQTSSGTPFDSLAFRALMLLPTEELLNLEPGEIVTFSSHPEGVQKHINAKELLSDYSAYESTYRTALAESAERLQLNAKRGLDPRTKLAIRSGKAERVVITATYSLDTVLALRVMFVDQNGWIVSSANVFARRAARALPSKKWTSLKLDITDDMKLYWKHFQWYFDEPPQLPTLDAPIFDVEKRDPFDWCYGTQLRQIAERSGKSLYAVIPDHVSPGLGMIWSGQNPDQWKDSTATLTHLYQFGWCDVREDEKKWLIHPVVRIENERNFLSRTPFAKLTSEFRKYKRLRPGMLGEYAVKQESQLMMDGWDREFMEIALIVPHAEVFNRFYRIGFLAWGLAHPNSEGNAPGSFVSTASTAGSAGKRLANELSTPTSLRMAFANSIKDDESMEHVSGWVLSESFPNGLPNNVGIWSRLTVEQVLLVNLGIQGSSTGAIPKRTSSINDYKNPLWSFAISDGEIFSFGVDQEGAQTTTMAFGIVPPDIKWLRFEQMPPDWKQWMEARTQEYQAKYPQVQPGTIPP
ncbi:MAG: hypothetical protein KF824_07000 [Fimbriimonadaceae bacterium]|nr:MAG: hypothetical protein KF824_07000 [Fimbriimonadaceae bacterium]